jgi:predicted lipase
MYSSRYYCQILTKIEFPDRLSINPKMSHFIKIRKMGEALYHGDGRTDRQADRNDKANTRF